MTRRPLLLRRRPPHAAGIGLRAAHVDEVMATRPPVGFLEVHAENYMSNGPALAKLLRLRRDYPVSLHAVGLSPGSAAPLSAEHLKRLRALIDDVEPCFVSEHLSWSTIGGRYLNDLLPLPYTDESLGIVSRNILKAQDALGRQLLIENPSSYLRYRHSTVPEPEFLAELVHRTHCGILCDVNNVFVSSRNLGTDPVAYVRALPIDAIGEIHVAGHHTTNADGVELLIDDHGSPVSCDVWSLYIEALRLFGGIPTLVERDANLPPLNQLVAEAHAADAFACWVKASDRRVVRQEAPYALAG
ncbi:DUF692 domain-containing protein [Vineibacter terrae]|uniref:MNIO family bufferin maturase n=1 Tax=Vineibacter terrae TaxID=2586908 RepID=UPI002E33F78F|nr:DUF692 domain-containing protein [Vineibacter terrae]HEX2891430.1 DUF692 domain-containing protein [Vineibacter terrae]